MNDKYIPPQRFKNAQEAFENTYDLITKHGIDQGHGTKAILNFGFYIDEPLDAVIKTDFRKFNLRYAQREWDWYLSKNRSVKDLKKFAPIWDKMHRGDNIVNSNYGYLWSEEFQLEKTIAQLRDNKTTRQAWITIFDGKNKDEFEKDTPCTLNIGFKILDGKLCMDVLMRSNDLWYGFCNDQYCFSRLQEIVALELGIPIGWYYHFSADMHLYNPQ